VACLRDLSTHLNSYLSELSRVIFRKENLQSDRRWWLSTFYSLSIQGYVRSLLLKVEFVGYCNSSNTGDFITSRASQYLHLALRLFIAVSAGFDPIVEQQESRSVLNALTTLTTLEDYYETARRAVQADSWFEQGIFSSFDYLMRQLEVDGTLLHNNPGVSAQYSCAEKCDLGRVFAPESSNSSRQIAKQGAEPPMNPGVQQDFLAYDSMGSLTEASEDDGSQYGDSISDRNHLRMEGRRTKARRHSWRTIPSRALSPIRQYYGGSRYDCSTTNAISTRRLENTNPRLMGSPLSSQMLNLRQDQRSLSTSMTENIAKQTRISSACGGCRQIQLITKPFPGNDKSLLLCDICVLAKNHSVVLGDRGTIRKSHTRGSSLNKALPEAQSPGYMASDFHSFRNPIAKKRRANSPPYSYNSASNTSSESLLDSLANWNQSKIQSRRSSQDVAFSRPESSASSIYGISPNKNFSPSSTSVPSPLAPSSWSAKIPMPSSIGSGASCEPKFICSCCPKRPKRFGTREELR
jgi:hypothetical protein